jgi:hypothetical protein
MKLYINTILAFGLLFWGALGRAFKGCSKADDIAHAGSYVKNLEHVPHQTNYKNLGRYVAAEAAIIKDPILLKRHMELTEFVDRRVLDDLALKNIEVKNQLQHIDDKFLPSEKMNEYGKLLEKYSKSINFKNYSGLFETLDFMTELKDFYDLYGNVDGNKYEEKTKDINLTKNNFKINIPNDLYEITSVTNPLVENIWANGKTAIFVYSFKNNYQQALKEWKESKEKNNKHLTIFAENENLINFKISDRENDIFGCLKVLREGKKILFVEVAFKQQVDFLKDHNSIVEKI